MLTFETPYSEEEINNRLSKIDQEGLFKQGIDSIIKDIQQAKKEGKIKPMKKYRVNYLLNESFHYSLVEAENEDAADEIVFDYLGEPDKYKLLGVEEDTTHVIEPGKDSAMAEIINKLIIDEWEAISGYNSASVTAQEMGLEDAAKLLSDLSKEETEHVGELQELLKSFDKNTHAITSGEEEAKDKLEESFSNTEIRSVMKKYKRALDYLEDK